MLTKRAISNYNEEVNGRKGLLGVMDYIRIMALFVALNAAALAAAARRPVVLMGVA